jgi:mannitol-specific phosphotransferase system IIBC component
MENHSGNVGTITGTAGGTVLSVFGNIQSGDMVKTVVLAMVGAVTSFAVSYCIKWVRLKLK